MLKVAIMSSTNGTDLPALFSAPLKDINFNCFITNKKNCGAHIKAKKFKIKDYVIEDKGEKFDKKAIKIIKKNQSDIILLVGFMKILSTDFLSNFPNAILNVHPSLLPAFAGIKDKNIHEQVLQRGCKISGATVHFVNEKVDSGPILLQECVKISIDETPDSLKTKIQKIEQKMLIKALEIIRDKKYKFENEIVKVCL